MFKRVHFLFLALVVLSMTAVALLGDIDLSWRDLSNAACLASGILLRSPKFGRFHPGQSTPVVGSRTPTPSLVPVSGNIKVTRANTGDLVGYVVGASSSNYGITLDLSSALKVAFTSGSNPIELAETPPYQISHPFLGGVAFGSDLTTGLSLSFAFIAGTSHTVAGPPTVLGTSLGFGVAKSTIWNYNSVTNELTPTWINSNSAAAPTTLYYFPLGNLLLLVCDPVAFNHQYSGGYVVKWTVV